MSKKDIKSTEMGLPWHIVEEAINLESEWLRQVIVPGHAEKVPGCDECPYTFRKMALLIITGKIRAKEFIARDGHDLWDNLTQKHGIKKSARHGGSWHRRMMDVITEYFKDEGFEVIPEPFLNKGRADLGIYKDGYPNLFAEVGTVSPYKLWWNLQMLTNAKILIVPDDKRAIEFTCRDDKGDVLRSAQKKGPI